MYKKVFENLMAPYVPKPHNIVPGETSQELMLRRILWDTIEQLRTTADGVLDYEGNAIFEPIITAFKQFESDAVPGVKKYRLQCILTIAAVMQNQPEPQPAHQPLYAEQTNSIGHHSNAPAGGRIEGVPAGTI